MDGKDAITAIREWSQVPIIVLTVRSTDEEVTTALNMGANDYVTKPFNVDVLLARINAALRSSAVHETGEPELRNGALRMDLVRHEVFLNDKLLAFTPKEYDLLRHFMVNRGKMLTHKEILKTVWGTAHADDTTYLRVYIGQIREKIEENPTAPVFITTEPGIGYRMEVFPHGVLFRRLSASLTSAFTLISLYPATTSISGYLQGFFYNPNKGSFYEKVTKYDGGHCSTNVTGRVRQQHG